MFTGAINPKSYPKWVLANNICYSKGSISVILSAEISDDAIITLAFIESEVVTEKITESNCNCF